MCVLRLYNISAQVLVEQKGNFGGPLLDLSVASRLLHVGSMTVKNQWPEAAVGIFVVTYSPALQVTKYTLPLSPYLDALLTQ
jgi:hypothetical protein